MGSDYGRYRVSFWSDENFLELGNDGGYKTLNILKPIGLYTFKSVNCTVWEFYHNKAIKVTAYWITLTNITIKKIIKTFFKNYSTTP